MFPQLTGIYYMSTKSQNTDSSEKEVVRDELSEIVSLSLVETSVNYIPFFDTIFSCTKQGPFLSSVSKIFRIPE